MAEVSKGKKPNTYLRFHRENRGWSQRKLAELIDVDPSMISRWESGERGTDPFYQEKLIELFGKNAVELGFINAAQQATPNSLQIDNKEATAASTALLHSSLINRQALNEYIQRQRASMLNTLAPGSTNLWVRDIIGSDGLFIPPPWQMLQGTNASTDLIAFLIDTLMSNQRILLLGEAGQGKTTVLKQVFTLMVDRFLEDTDNVAPLPLYIPLREIASLAGNPIEILWAYVHDEFPLPFEDFSSLVRNNHIVFLFDGFDEIKGELTQPSINERSMSKVFARPSILSCRRSFFDFYLSMSALQEYYPQRVELQPLTLTHAIQYIMAYCEKQYNSRTYKIVIDPQRIIEIIRTNQELQDLAQRPLLLFMMLDILTDPREMSETSWDVVKLYRKYTEKWLKNEAAKPDSVLKWNEKAVLMQELARLTYTPKSSASLSFGELNQSITFTLNDLTAFVKKIGVHYPRITESQLLDDLCFRTLLSTSEGEIYSFLHKSFQEYYVARYIVDCMRSREQHPDAVAAVENVLQEFLPWDVGTFLKGILVSEEISTHDKDLIVSMLIKVYQRNGKDDPRSVTIRQHASHYMTLVGTKQAVEFLEQACEREPNKWVQRGIMVGLALYCDRTDILERYINIIRQDTEAASINIGYHLVYYGDQAEELGYYDRGGEKCDGTIQAILRRLRDERFRKGWVLDMLTLSTLLEQRGMKILSPYKQQLPFLQEFLCRDHQDLGDIFQQEKERLEKILEGETL
jgi:transcriptional regulator with XRE-family HTH domain